jgi:hypothetical protein
LPVLDSRHGSLTIVIDIDLEQATELISLNASLTDEQKMIAEYWANGPHSEQPPGHWDLFAQFVSIRDRHTVDEDAKMFFALTNAIFDAGIACWDAKRVFDSVRPATAIPYLFHGQQISAWGGPGKGTVTMDGPQWIPYQPSTFPTPPFPEYVSGHSTFSAAGATILALWTGSETFGQSVTFPAGSSVIERNISPARPVTLSWATFHDAANEAGMSRRYGGIHFRTADLVGRALGNMVGAQAWEKAQEYFNGPRTRGGSASFTESALRADGGPPAGSWHPMPGPGGPRMALNDHRNRSIRRMRADRGETPRRIPQPDQAPELPVAGPPAM